MRLPPGPRGVVQVWPQAKGFAADPVGAMAAIHRRYGPVACMRILGDLLVFVAEPELVGEVLLDREGIFIKDKVTHSLGRFLGQGLLTSENPLWRRQRRLIAPSLTRRHIELYAGAMARAADRYARARVDGELRDLHADMTAVTLEIVVETLFGASFTGSVELVGQMMDAVMHNFERVSRSWKRKLPEWAPVRERRSMDAAAGVLDAMVLEIIRERRASGVLGDDLLSRLIAARDDAGSGMSDEQLRDEAVTLFVAGHETTANALTFALMLLAEHPEEDARRRAECAAVLGDRLPGVADLPRLRQSEAVIKESLRLYPPA
ncbi:MAG: cytochrome P450, partial [Myxococcales bacterium]|nr:cytochrome P450 [Myxococcales bacterium]